MKNRVTSLASIARHREKCYIMKRQKETALLGAPEAIAVGLLGVSMTYTTEYIEKSAYFHVIIRGENTTENIISYINEIYDKCKEKNITKILIEERLEGPRLNVINIFQIIIQIAPKVIGQFIAIAYVDMNRKEPIKFLENVAINRGLPVRIFSDVQTAVDWLAG
jgi:hypothetical protein